MLRAPAIARVLSRECYQGEMQEGRGEERQGGRGEKPGEQFPFSREVREEAAAGPFELEVLNERRFAILEEGRLVTGSIDRLVLLTRDWKRFAADVIDFKTDAFPDDRRVIQERIDHYRDQLSAYVRAVSRMYGLPQERIRARLVLLTLGQVETV
jgi:ATP-dependent helicase/nuclease subunit A